MQCRMLFEWQKKNSSSDLWKYHTADLIRKWSSKTEGGLGPSGSDADGWKRIIHSNQFKPTSDDLDDTLLREFWDLIHLDKNPGLRPIWWWGGLRRIGKAIITTFRENIFFFLLDLYTSLAGHEASCEAGIH